MLSGASQALRWLRLRARRARTPSRQQMPARAGHVPSTSQQGFPGAARPNTFLSHEWGGTRYLRRFLTVSKGGSCRKTQSSRAQVPKVMQGLILSTSYTSAPPGRDVCHPWADEFQGFMGLVPTPSNRQICSLEGFYTGLHHSTCFRTSVAPRRANGLTRQHPV